MFSEFSTKVKPKNNNAKIVFLITFLLSVVAFVTYFLMEQYRGFAGLFGFLLLVSAILFYTKYIAVDFYYDLTKDSEGTPIFVVRQIVGKRETTLCRISLSDIVKIEKETKKERSAHKTEHGVIKYVYAPTLFPSVSYRVTVKNRYERAELIIEGSDEYIAMLSEYAKEARENRVEEDE